MTPGRRSRRTEPVKSLSVPWSRDTPVAAAKAEAAGVGAWSAAEFRTFYDRTARPLWAYLSRTAGSPDLADDLVQEAFLRLLRSDFVPETEAHAKNYLYRIATNLVRDRFRRQRRQRAAGEVETVERSSPPSDRATSRCERSGGDASRGPDAPGSGPGDPGRGVRLRRDLGRFLAKLRPQDRQLLWLAHVEGASHREIAEVLGVQEASVRVLVFRARKRLAEMLEAHDLGPEVLT